MNAVQERFAALRLARSRGIGPVTYRQLVRKFGSAEAAIAELPQFLAAKKVQGRISIAPETEIETELSAIDRKGATLLVLGDEAYPELLAAIADPPPVLTVIGDTALLGRAGVAIVGARNASAAGRRMAADLAGDLGDFGWVITSGLARGIDGAAHEASLGTGTIAVLAGGVDSIYPPEHAELYHAIAAQGAVISEMRMGQTATARDFPKRNRIVSGLTRGVVVVEAAERSGTLITARLSLEQGRDVCAVPGSPLDPRSAGTNRLIRQGAVLVRHADDVMTALGDMEKAPPAPFFQFEEDEQAPLPEEEQSRLKDEIISLLSLTPIHRDELLRLSSASPAQLADILLDLVLSGTADEGSGGMFTLSASA
ncbi:DNA-processing protein DprA [Parvularcula marina]|uniref:DNA-protecting protein DprA n=1 Tax=Parvularcula marina TaxID=2292771 RepID=A0A371RGP4_9PROT|nr:DNA-processing protein DprA [Parvularcula marina]RFB04609.1 DNA-protecting protein DprA [Parvularcula marina]